MLRRGEELEGYTLGNPCTPRRTNRMIVKSTSTDGRCTVNGTIFKFNAPAMRMRSLPADRPTTPPG